MLSALVDKLGGLLPKYFFLGTYLPVLTCVILNCLLLYYLDPRFEHTVGPLTSLTDSALLLVAVFAASILLAYMLSSISSF